MKHYYLYIHNGSNRETPNCISSYPALEPLNGEIVWAKSHFATGKLRAWWVLEIDYNYETKKITSTIVAQEISEPMVLVEINLPAKQKAQPKKKPMNTLGSALKWTTAASLYEQAMPTSIGIDDIADDEIIDNLGTTE